MDKNKEKKLIWIYSIMFVIVLIVGVITFITYTKNSREKLGMVNLGDDIDEEQIAEASSEVVSANNTIVANSSIVDKTLSNVNNVTEKTKNTVSEQKQVVQNNNKKNEEEDKTKKVYKENNTNVELNFVMPVDGEIIKGFAKDRLVYSNTLEEWTTHLGIDIKAPKTTVVKSVEKGKVKSIKNDPRYGLTVIIEHDNGFESQYSNLLTAEFITEGENLTKGQTIGTVGSTAVFEVEDEPHLHFELKKDNNNIDPCIYLK